MFVDVFGVFLLQVVVETMQQQCRCHGVSGSCAMKTCWETIRPLREISLILKSKYIESVKLAQKAGATLQPRNKRSNKNIGSDELVFAKNSPNYCRRNKRRGVLGTRGRACQLRGGGSDSCESLCCGRGHNTRLVRTIEKCHCQFVWCCEVVCKMCEREEEKHFCK